MKINDFKLEQYFGEHEFSTNYLLCCSDCETITIEELLALEPQARDSFLDSRLGYSESPGDPLLRQEISQMYSQVDGQGILEFTGAQEAIFNFMVNALQAGDHMIAMFPNYQSTYEICRWIGCEVSHWELAQSTQGWIIDTDSLKKLIKPNTKVIAVCSPNNPTGYQLSPEQTGAITALARQHGIMVFSDEVYRGLAENEPPPFADVYENAFSLNVLSKAYGLPGLRLGWLASQNKPFLNIMLNFKYYISICGAVPSQKLAIIALRHRERLFQRNREIIAGNLKYSDQFFHKYERLFQYNRQVAGPIAFHRLKINMPVADFCLDLLRQKGVLLAHGALFDMAGNYFRMGYGRKNFKECVDLLDEYADMLIESAKI